MTSLLFVCVGGRSPPRRVSGATAAAVQQQKLCVSGMFPSTLISAAVTLIPRGRHRTPQSRLCPRPPSFATTPLTFFGHHESRRPSPYEATTAINMGVIYYVIRIARNASSVKLQQQALSFSVAVCRPLSTLGISSYLHPSPQRR